MRTIVLAAMLICFTLMVPLTVSVIELFVQSPSVPRSELGFNSGYNAIRDTLVSLQEEPGSGGGGGGVI